MLDLQGHWVWPVLGGNITCHEDLGDFRIDEERRTAEVMLPPSVQDTFDQQRGYGLVTHFRCERYQAILGYHLCLTNIFVPLPKARMQGSRRPAA